MHEVCIYKLAWRIWKIGQHGPVYFYVANRKGDGGADWGYTENPSKALPLSPYWQRRFAADCTRAGTTAHFLPAP